jgi:hypothetical protein
MKRDYTQEGVRNSMYAELSILMEKVRAAIVAGSRDFYSLPAHDYLARNAFEIMFPLPEAEWPPLFKASYYDYHLPWPQGTVFAYAMDVMVNRSALPMLRFGYVVTYDGRLLPATFYATERLTRHQDMPQGMVIDPLAVVKGMLPEYYIGCEVDQYDIENYPITHKHPLETCIAGGRGKNY